jgi:hypothetical protein
MISVARECTSCPTKSFGHERHTNYDTLINSFIHSFIHSTDICRMRLFLAVLRSFFNSSLLHILSFHPFPRTCLPSSLTSFCHLFLSLPLSLVASEFIYLTYLGILFSSILCPCPNQHNLFNLIVSSNVFLTVHHSIALFQLPT